MKKRKTDRKNEWKEDEEVMMEWRMELGDGWIEKREKNKKRR